MNVALLNYGRKTFCSVTFSLRKHYLLNVCHSHLCNPYGSHVEIYRSGRDIVFHVIETLS
jgi:hypothetical protein